MHTRECSTPWCSTPVRLVDECDGCSRPLCRRCDDKHGGMCARCAANVKRDDQSEDHA